MAAADGFSVSEVQCRFTHETRGSRNSVSAESQLACSTCSLSGSKLAFARKPLLLFGLLARSCSSSVVIVGIVAILWRVIGGVGFRPLVNLVETCVTVGSVLFATGLLGENDCRSACGAQSAARAASKIYRGTRHDGRSLTK